LVVGEGEPAIIPLLEAVRGDAKLDDVPNLAFVDRETGRFVTTERVVPPDLDALPAPIYEVPEFGYYLTPLPVVLLAPTRGCYWDRCAFCSYGLRLEGRATAPYREISPPRLVDHLRQVLGETGSRHVIFAIDVMRPAAAESYAKAFRAARLDFL